MRMRITQLVCRLAMDFEIMVSQRLSVPFSRIGPSFRILVVFVDFIDPLLRDNCLFIFTHWVLIVGDPTSRYGWIQNFEALLLQSLPTQHRDTLLPYICWIFIGFIQALKITRAVTIAGLVINIIFIVNHCFSCLQIWRLQRCERKIRPRLHKQYIIGGWKMQLQHGQQAQIIVTWTSKAKLSPHLHDFIVRKCAVTDPTMLNFICCPSYHHQGTMLNDYDVISCSHTAIIDCNMVLYSFSRVWWCFYLPPWY